MRAFLIRRLIGLVFVLVGISVVTFVLSHVLPADPARVALGGKAGAEQYQAIRNLQSDEIKLAAGGFISNSGPSIGYYEPTCGGGWGG